MHTAEVHVAAHNKGKASSTNEACEASGSLGRSSVSLELLLTAEFHFFFSFMKIVVRN